MNDRQLLRQLNREIDRLDNPDWWQPHTRRVDPARMITVPLVRASDKEVIAKAFFASVARDPELLARRAGILAQWRLR
jgi:hypothetical protein